MLSYMTTSRKMNFTQPKLEQGNGVVRIDLGVGRRRRQCRPHRRARFKSRRCRALANLIRKERSRSSGRPIDFGYTPDGRRIAVVYETIDATTLYPVTTYEVE